MPFVENLESSHPYQDASGYWMTERDTCQYCLEERRAENKPARENEVRTSFGCYAGRYCDKCWSKSGYRDATDPDVHFDPMDAGEVLEAEDY